MSKAAESLVRAYYDAFDSQDWPAFFDLLSDDVVHDLNQGGRENGKAAFRSFMERMNRCYRERLVDIVVLTDRTGGRAAAEFVVEGTYLVTDEGLPAARGQTYRLPGGAFFQIERGSIVRVTNYYDPQDWLAQVTSGT